MIYNMCVMTGIVGLLILGEKIPLPFISFHFSCVLFLLYITIILFILMNE